MFRRDRAMSGLLTGVVVVLVVCHTPKTFLNIQVSSSFNLHSGLLELETKAFRRFAKFSIVSYNRPSLMIIVSASQFHVYLPWGQHPFSIVS